MFYYTILYYTILNNNIVYYTILCLYYIMISYPCCENGGQQGACEKPAGIGRGICESDLCRGENVVTVSMTTSDISGLLIIERFEEYC